MNTSRIAVALIVVVGLALTVASAVTSQAEENTESAASAWIHEDLKTAYEVAEKSGKPLLIAFR